MNETNNGIAVVLAMTLVISMSSAAQAADVPEIETTSESEAAPSETYSKIDGQLVPVGEHTRFEYGYYATNLEFNPIGPIFGLWSVGVSHGVSNHLGFRADLSVLRDYDDGHNSGMDLTLSLRVHFKKMHDGLFFEPGVRILAARGLDSSVGPQATLGYQWMWDGGWNLLVALGASRNDGDVLPAGFLRVGKAF